MCIHSEDSPDTSSEEDGVSVAPKSGFQVQPSVNTNTKQKAGTSFHYFFGDIHIMLC